MKKFWKKTSPVLKNKYFIATAAFLFFLLLLDNNSLIQRFSLLHERNNLREENRYYREKIKNDHNRIEEISTNRQTLEKFAREQYNMKKTDEEVFIIVEEEENGE